MRRRVAAFSAGVVAVALLGGSLAATLRGGDPAVASPERTETPRDLGPEDIYPSLANDALAGARSYGQLFERGQTLATAAKPACFRYRAVRRSWARRAGQLDESSRGAAASKRAARTYYAGVTWVSQDEAGDFDAALYRISRSRLSTATGRIVRRESLVAAFTGDALELCGLGSARERTRARLATLDQRIMRIIDLARFRSGAGLSDGVAQ